MENKRWEGPRRGFLPVYSDSTHWFDCASFLCYWEGDPFYETDKSWFESTSILESADMNRLFPDRMQQNF